jgi:predicted nucleic acid-binding Zn finger protein
MKGQLGKGLNKHLFGLKYYIETGKTVNLDNYSEVFKNYK